MMYMKVTAPDSGGRYTMFEDVSQPGEGPPLHLHHNEDETFYVLKGRYLFEVDGKQFEVQEGDTVFAARGTHHCFQNISTSPGTLLVMLEPGGSEAFFTELAAVEGPPTPEKVAPIFVKHGLELLGPPLSAR